MNKNTIQNIIDDCKVMLRKYGDIPYDKVFIKTQKEFGEIGRRYGITGADVFKILMENFPRRNDK
ncbi:hypothetical protein [Acetivibrio mesophilus]|uniref:Uncharacterized protein n=1 Tax=Acetivibrio mesophilus TaxID=2487273 RepID=A0A4Q0I1J2_9FIRM|nr:hypothetical protein [Acetivibrio mesophilus]RXE58023.1 hypothetical protein EFD62_14685 [Acetivibrio mesophilus]